MLKELLIDDEREKAIVPDRHTHNVRTRQPNALRRRRIGSHR
jgi:hypothetical protein